MYFFHLRTHCANIIIAQNSLNIIAHIVNSNSRPYAGRSTRHLSIQAACNLNILIIGSIVDNHITAANNIIREHRLHAAVDVVSRTGSTKVNRTAAFPTRTDIQTKR